MIGRSPPTSSPESPRRSSSCNESANSSERACRRGSRASRSSAKGGWSRELYPAPPHRPPALLRAPRVLPPRAVGVGARALFPELRRRPRRRGGDCRCRRRGPLRSAAMEGGVMEGSITARTLDYFGWLVAASVGALLHLQTGA